MSVPVEIPGNAVLNGRRLGADWGVLIQREPLPAGVDVRCVAYKITLTRMDALGFYQPMHELRPGEHLLVQQPGSQLECFGPGEITYTVRTPPPGLCRRFMRWLATVR